jgi:bacillithiol system protein YtxJ
MNWIPLTEIAQLQQIIEASNSKPQVIFKHSTRCATSAMIKSRLERAEAPASLDFYYLDLIAFRSVSNEIEELFRVAHESPQLLLIKNGVCVYDESHYGISMDEAAEQAQAA